jgi:glycosyltransferase involved in cell wall biosynthesis
MDSLELRLGRQVQTAGWPHRWLFREELRRMRGYERHVHALAEAVIVVSSQDAHFFPASKVTVIENGVDLELFTPVPALRRTAHLAFSGRMGYTPNAEAALWFVRECLPVVRQSVPEVTLSIVGADPPRAVRSLAQAPGVEVTGYVRSIADALNQASVVVAPLLSGSGMQNKVLEAMACGRPVVTTSIGLGGIRATSRNELAVADGPEAFAAAVVSLLENPSGAEAMGRRARAFVVENHTWAHAAERVEDLYRQLLRSRP